MSNNVYYFGVDTPNNCLARNVVDEDYIYAKCPAINHQNSRIFIAHSPIDIEIKVDRTPDGNMVRCNHPHLLEYDDDYFHAPKPVLQLKSPMFFFWTDDDNVWFEFDHHSMTSLNNNFVAVGGWFNLSNWSKATSLAFTIVDETKPVIIKKGDPVCRIRFHPPNLDEGINLREVKDPKIVKEMKVKYAKKRQKEEQGDWKSRLFSRTDNTSKCPVSFLINPKKKKKSKFGDIQKLGTSKVRGFK